MDHSENPVLSNGNSAFFTTYFVFLSQMKPSVYVLWKITFKLITLCVNAVLSFLNTETWRDNQVDKDSWVTRCGLGVRNVGVNLPQGAAGSYSSLHCFKVTSALIPSATTILLAFVDLGKSWFITLSLTSPLDLL